MSDDAPKKRPWFQIHLSTAIVLMVMAGLLVWANVRPIEVIETYTARDQPYQTIRGPGWPVYWEGTFACSSIEEAKNSYYYRGREYYGFAENILFGILSISEGVPGFLLEHAPVVRGRPRP